MELELVYSFDDQSKSFVHGVEAGEIDYRLREGAEIIDTSKAFPLHKENMNIYRKMADAYGYDVTFSVCKDENGVIYDEYIHGLFVEKIRNAPSANV